MIALRLCLDKVEKHLQPIHGGFREAGAGGIGKRKGTGGDAFVFCSVADV